MSGTSASTTVPSTRPILPTQGMRKAPPMSLLFHPKKGKKGSIPVKRTSSASPRPQKIDKDEEDDDLGIKLPEWPHQDFKLLSTALSGWKYDVMKLDAFKSIDVASWQKPVRLNRKDLRRAEALALAQASGEAVGLRPMLGLDGKEVYGKDGQIVMVDIEGKVVGASGQSKNPAGKKKFQKKTKQVFVVPEEVRQLRKEERYPWVLEDGVDNGETWVGQLEDTTKAETHAIFMPAANECFKFVPTHRWYKFSRKLKHDLPTDTQAVESAYQKAQKQESGAWLRQRAASRGFSNSTLATLEGRENLEGSLVQSSSGSSLGPGGRKLKAVDNGMSLFGDDADDEDDKGALKRKLERELGGEGDFDEMLFEEDFADDDERVEQDGDEEESKELEERMKREYKQANKQREGYIDESDSEYEDKKRTKQEKRLKKMLMKREGNDVYDSDEDSNPYASEEEESEEEEVPPPPSVPEPPKESKESSLPNSKAHSLKPNGSQAPSPTSSMGGHSIVAKRATNAKAPKLKTSTSQATSPLVSPSGSRAGSPVSPATVTNPKKRKAQDDTTNINVKQKKRKAIGGGDAVGTGVTEAMLLGWIKQTPSPTTKGCIERFKPVIGHGGQPAFTAMVKRVAVLKDGVLLLRKQYL